MMDRQRVDVWRCYFIEEGKSCRRCLYDSHTDKAHSRLQYLPKRAPSFEPNTDLYINLPVHEFKVSKEFVPAR